MIVHQFPQTCELQALLSPREISRKPYDEINFDPSFNFPHIHSSKLPAIHQDLPQCPWLSPSGQVMRAIGRKKREQDYFPHFYRRGGTSTNSFLLSGSARGHSAWFLVPDSLPPRRNYTHWHKFIEQLLCATSSSKCRGGWTDEEHEVLAARSLPFLPGCWVEPATCRATCFSCTGLNLGATSHASLPHFLLSRHAIFQQSISQDHRDRGASTYFLRYFKILNTVTVTKRMQYFKCRHLTNQHLDNQGQNDI